MQPDFGELALPSAADAKRYVRYPIAERSVLKYGTEIKLCRVY